MPPLLARRTGPGQLLFHIVAAYSCGGQYVAGERVDCTCQLALPTHSCLGAFMWPGDGSTVLASQPQPPRLFGCGFMWGPICGRATGRLYLQAGPDCPDFLVADSCGGQYAAREWVGCTCQPALPTHTFLGAFIPWNAVAGEPAHSLLAFVSSPHLPSTDCRPQCLHSQCG